MFMDCRILELQLIVNRLIRYASIHYLSLDIYYFSLSPSLSHPFLSERILTVELSHITIDLVLYDSMRDFNVENRDYRQEIQSDFLYFFFLMDLPQIIHYSSFYLDTPLFCWQGQYIQYTVVDSSPYIDTLITRAQLFAVSVHVNVYD